MMRDLESFADVEYWRTQASLHNLRMPNKLSKCTDAGMRKVLRRWKITVPEYVEWNGKLEEWRDNNPEYPLAAWAGVTLLEHLQRYSRYSTQNSDSLALSEDLKAA